MIKINVFITKNYMMFAELFLKSLKKFNGQHIPVLFNTINLSDKDIDNLHSLYSNINISNKNLTTEEIYLETGITKKQFKACENQCINRDKKSNIINKKIATRYKQFIAVNQRVRSSLQDAVDWCNQGDLLVHFDADTFINGSLDSLFEFMLEHDISIRARLNEEYLNKRFLISLFSLTISPVINEFISCWYRHIDNVDLFDRPKGYGQTSFFYAYEEMKEKLSWGNLIDIVDDRSFDSIVVKSSMLKQYSKSKDLYVNNLNTIELCERRLNG